MANNDMKHMAFIDSVGQNDAAVLRMKEETYQGSWKRAGGRSAWFMMRRNMDRLITMMAERPATIALEGFDQIDDGRVSMTLAEFKAMQAQLRSEDIFAMIGAEPSGKDGTVLACLRDLRRYLMLIEAEMRAEGVVNFEPVRIVEERSTSKSEVFAAHYGKKPVEDRLVTVVLRLEAGNDGEPANEYVFPNSPSVQMESEPGQITITITPGVSDGFQTESAPSIKVPERRVPRYLDEDSFKAKPHPGNGSHHATLHPWEITKEFFEILRGRIGANEADKFYRQMGPNMWRLYPIVVTEKMPTELRGQFVLSPLVSNTWVVKMLDVPAELRDSFPRLMGEMNDKEYDTSLAEYKFMYWRHNEKWTLREAFRNEDWAQEA